MLQIVPFSFAIVFTFINMLKYKSKIFDTPHVVDEIDCQDTLEKLLEIFELSPRTLHTVNYNGESAMNSGYNQYYMTRKEVAIILKVSVQTVSIVENRALRKLRHPNYKRKLRSFCNDEDLQRWALHQWDSEKQKEVIVK